MNATTWNKLSLRIKFTVLLSISFVLLFSLLGSILFKTTQQNHIQNINNRMHAHTHDLYYLLEINGQIHNNTGLKTVIEHIKNKPTLSESFPVLISAEGQVLWHPLGHQFSLHQINQLRQQKRGYISYSRPETGRDQQRYRLYFRFHEASNLFVATLINEQHVLYQPLSGLRNLIIFSIIIGIVGLVVLLSYLMKKILKPVNEISHSLENLALGIHTSKHEILRQDEIGKISGSLNKLIDGLAETATFANEIGKRNFDHQYVPLSQSDVLGNALIGMRESLRMARKEEDSRKLEDQKRNWTTEGLARFSDILRLNTNNLENLSFDIIKNLVKYLDINQGGLFILNDEYDKPFLELKACYAYDRQKFLNKTIQLGEGIAGTCFLEKETIYLKKVPQNYINITSGLGAASPNTLLVVPLKLNENVYGAIELASFKEFQQFEIEFVEKIAESIASTLSSVKTAIKTKELLNQSQQQAEEMKAQEEEMRQNMEEMQATQEEMARKEGELNGLLKSINDSYLFAEFANNGNILTVNNNFLTLFNMTAEDMIGHHHSEFDTMSENKEEYRKFWEDLNQGKIIKKDSETVFPDRVIWLSETYSPVLGRSGSVIKIILLARDITEAKLQQNAILEQAEIMKSQQEELRQNMEELLTTQEEMANKEEELSGLFTSINDSYLFAEFALDGKVINVNKNFLELFGLSYNDIVGQNHSEFDTAALDKESYKDFWNKLSKGEIINKQSETVLPDRTVWLAETYSPVVNKNGKVVKIILLANDITTTKMQELEIVSQTEELKSQQEELRQNLEEMQTQEEELRQTLEAAEKSREETISLKEKTDAVINNMPGIVYQCLMDEYFTMEYISPYCEKITGYKPEDFVNSNTISFSSLIHPDDLELVNNTIEKAIKKKEKFYVEYRIKDKNGKYHTVGEHGSFLTNQDGEIHHLQGMIFELTSGR